MLRVFRIYLQRIIANFVLKQKEYNNIKQLKL